MKKLMKNQFIRYFIFFIINGFISILYLGFIGNTFYNGMINLIAHNYWTVIFLLLSMPALIDSIYCLFTVKEPSIVDGIFVIIFAGIALICAIFNPEYQLFHTINLTIGFLNVIFNAAASDQYEIINSISNEKIETLSETNDESLNLYKDNNNHHDLINLIIDNKEDIKIICQEYIDNTEDIVNQLEFEGELEGAKELDARLDLAEEIMNKID